MGDSERVQSVRGRENDVAPLGSEKLTQADGRRANWGDGSLLFVGRKSASLLHPTTKTISGGGRTDGRMDGLTKIRQPLIM